jgi:hypothetical protein
MRPARIRGFLTWPSRPPHAGRTRNVGEEDSKHLLASRSEFMDRVGFEMYWDGKVVRLPVTIVLRVDPRGMRKAIGLQPREDLSRRLLQDSAPNVLSKI